MTTEQTQCQQLATVATAAGLQFDSPITNPFAAFYDFAERYGAAFPATINILARIITGHNKISGANWLWAYDDDDPTHPKCEPWELRAVRQWSNFCHPYTCNDDNCRSIHRDPLHPRREGGWVCLHCGLVQ